MVDLKKHSTIHHSSYHTNERRIVMKSVTTLIALLLLSVFSLTAQTAWKTDRSHSQVKFTVTHMLVSEVEGRFKEFDVTFQQGKDDFSESTVEATIKIASVSTDNEFRDKDLMSDNFFNAEKFPDMKFKSTSFEKTGENKYKITGDLTIRDVTKQVVLDTRLTGPITDQRGNGRIGVKATTTIDRFDYGVKWDRMVDATNLVVSKNVDITLLFELIKPSKEEPKPPVKN